MLQGLVLVGTSAIVALNTSMMMARGMGINRSSFTDLLFLYK